MRDSRGGNVGREVLRVRDEDITKVADRSQADPDGDNLINVLLWKRSLSLLLKGFGRNHSPSYRHYSTRRKNPPPTR